MGGRVWVKRKRTFLDFLGNLYIVRSLYLTHSCICKEKKRLLSIRFRAWFPAPRKLVKPRIESKSATRRCRNNRRKRRRRRNNRRKSRHRCWGSRKRQNCCRDVHQFRFLNSFSPINSLIQSKVSEINEKIEKNSPTGLKFFCSVLQADFKTNNSHWFKLSIYLHFGPGSSYLWVSVDQKNYVCSIYKTMFNFYFFYRVEEFKTCLKLLN